MISRTIKLRFRRTFRKRKKDAILAAEEAEQQLERHFFRRLVRLTNVRRFVTGWILLVVLLTVSVGLQARSLGSYYQKIAPIEGGTLREGAIGAFTNANPLYAVSVVDGSVSRLLFSGLFTHDINNNLIPDLADKWESDDKGQVYTVSLRKSVSWHDGKPFTAKDVEFTYQTIQNPDAKSPLLASWQGVTIKAIDDYTVQFTLPSPLAAFPYSLTNGIIPVHILGTTPASQLRSVSFNAVNPVGTGPFIWKSVEVSGLNREDRSEQVALKRNESYHLGQPKIEQYVLRTFKDESAMVRAYQNKELTSMVGLDKTPADIQQDTTSTSYNIPTDSAVMTFFNTSTPILADAKVRQALVAGTNRADLIKQLGFTALTTTGPLLKGQVGYDPTIVQQPYSLEVASKLLDEAGWKVTSDGTRKKADAPLTLHFVSQNVAEYAAIAQDLQKQWKALGIDLDVKIRPEEDMQGDVLTRHDYDILLYGISIGRDPDVFAYWHSSQADVRATSRLNFSEYKNKVADKALEAGRTRVDASLRAVKYKPFLVAWRDDAPAISLYQPRFLYISRTELTGFNTSRIGAAVDRLNNIQNWTVLQDKVLK